MRRSSMFIDVLAPYGFREMNLADRLTGPSARFLLGTDHVGRDSEASLSFLGFGLPADIPSWGGLTVSVAAGWR